MKKLFVVILVTLASGFGVASADEDYFADKPAPVPLMSGGYEVSAKPQATLRLAERSVVEKREVRNAQAKDQSRRPKVLIPDFVAW